VEAGGAFGGPAHPGLIADSEAEDGSGDGSDGGFGGGRSRRRRAGRAGVISDGDDEEFDLDDYDEDAEMLAQYAAASAWRQQLVSRAGFPPPPPLPKQ
jgi:hypothetical protein